jgi:replicative DNA helicase
MSLRVTPHNLDAEASVLGGIFLRNEVLSQLDTLEVEDFYSPKHQAVFQAMRNLESTAKPIDPVTVNAELDRMGKAEAVGGLGFLSELTLRVPSAENVVSYAEIVQDKRSAAKVIRAASEILEKGFEDENDVREYLDMAEAKIFEVTQRREKSGPEPIKSLIKKVFGSLDERFASADGVTGVPTGFTDLDSKTAGLQPTELIILAARPAMGKTSFAMSLAQNAAISGGWPVIVFSLEMSSTQLAERLLCSEARVDSSALRRGQLQRQDMTNLTYAANTLSKAPILIDDTPALSLRELRARARRFRSSKELFDGPLGKKKTGLIVIDYLQLMRGSPQAAKASREQEISEISRGLKSLAKELGCPVLALSQLNRSLESRTDKRPQLSDLRECVTGDTLVLLADGRRAPIASLVGTTPTVVTMTPDGKLAHAASDAVWCVGRRPVFDLRLASGRALRATGKHRLYGADGWVQVSALAAGDRLALARTLPAPIDPVRWPESRVILLAHLIGDGSYLSGQPMRYTTESEDNSAAVQTAAEAEPGMIVKRYAGRRRWHQLLLSGNGTRWEPRGVNRWLRELGVFGQRSHQKRVPAEVFRLDNQQIALFLRHLWATDGSIWTSGPGESTQRSRVHYATTSPGLAADVAALLLRLGIVARVRQIQQKGYRPSFPVDVSGADQQRRFLDVVGAFGPRVPQADRLRALLTHRRANTNVDTLPASTFARVRDTMRARGISQRAMATLRGTSYGGHAHFAFAPSREVVAGYAELLDDDALRAQATSDLFWDRVVSIEPAGDEDVYDLTVPGPASWLADGVVSHNSGAIEQDADVILFIYRDVIYNKDTEVPNIAEVIIGKNRHGATGTVETHFEGRFTRFENLSQRSEGPPQ